jgi:hypothetical protein
MVSRLKNICQQLGEKEPPMDKNFYACNLHAYETSEDLVIPEGVRIIMFCYSGRILNICPRFDKFNWKQIFTNKDASYNYCTFLSNLVQYSTLRNHFCVYEPGSTIKDLKFIGDKYFRDGVFQLPVKAAVMDWDDNIVYTTSDKVTEHVMTTRPASLQMDSATSIRKNRDKAVTLLRYKENPAYIKSSHMDMLFQPLSTLIKNLKFRSGGCTLLLLTCREGKRHKLRRSPRVYDELKKLYQKYRSKTPT